MNSFMGRCIVVYFNMKHCWRRHVFIALRKVHGILEQTVNSQSFLSYDMQITCKAYRVPRRILDCIVWQIECEAYLTIGTLIEKTETHILVGLFVLCKVC